MKIDLVGDVYDAASDWLKTYIVDYVRDNGERPTWNNLWKAFEIKSPYKMDDNRTRSRRGHLAKKVGFRKVVSHMGGVHIIGGSELESLLANDGDSDINTNTDTNTDTVELETSREVFVTEKDIKAAVREVLKLVLNEGSISKLEIMSALANNNLPLDSQVFHVVVSRSMIVLPENDDFYYLSRDRSRLVNMWINFIQEDLNDLEGHVISSEDLRSILDEWNVDSVSREMVVNGLDLKTFNGYQILWRSGGLDRVEVQKSLGNAVREVAYQCLTYGYIEKPMIVEILSSYGFNGSERRIFDFILQGAYLTEFEKDKYTFSNRPGPIFKEPEESEDSENPDVLIRSSDGRSITFLNQGLDGVSRLSARFDADGGSRLDVDFDE